jgi:glycosyltransferase involved in cell wall biosynthesis
MKLLLINWRDIRNPEAGGAEVYYHELFRRLVGMGVEVDLLAHAWRGAPAEEVIDGIRVFRRGSRGLFNYQIVPFVKRRQSRYDLVVEDLNKLPFFTPLYLRTPRLHLVMHFFGMSIFHETIPPFAAYVLLSEWLVGRLYRGERFVAISNSTADEVRRRVGHVRSVDVVEPGIDTAFYRPSTPKSPTPLLVCVTRIMRYKKVQFVIDAMPRLREQLGEVQLAVAGRGAYTEQLRARARRLGLEHCVRFLGRVSEEEKRDLLSQATLFVNPSAKEGWGITSMEAALCGTATVASDVPGLRDSVRDGETGVLFPFGNRDAFVEAVVSLVKDEERRRRMEQRARDVALTYGWDEMAKRLHAILTRGAT